MNLLEIKDLRLGFSPQNETEVLKGVNLSIPRNKIIGIVGESGSGKTLTGFSILQLLSPNALIQGGEILWHDQNSTIDLLKLSSHQIRSYRGKSISMVFQEALSALNPVLTCGFQISEAVKAHFNLKNSEVKERVLQTLLKVGLVDPARIYHSFPHELSGGQMQRVLIAQAIINRPQLIIADEPTTALDVSIQKHILRLFKQIQQEVGCSILFISHDLGLVKELCDEVAVMQSGRIIEQAPVKELFSNPVENYTKGLLHCRPPLKRKVKKLLTVSDFKSPDSKQSVDFEYLTNEEIVNAGTHFTDKKNLLECKDLTIRYLVRSDELFGKNKYFEAVKKVNLNIKEGEIVGLVGESGSGKSSIGKAIVKLVHANDGIISYKGRDIRMLRSTDLKNMRREIQMVFQDPYSSLNPMQKIGTSIIEPMRIHNLYANDKERYSRSVYLLESVGLHESHFHRYPHQFSGGQRQRVCIARALSVNPSLIICDEAVSALDVSVQAQILNLLKELRERFSLSYLFISHDLSVVHFLSDRIIVLKGGQIVEANESTKLINQPMEEYTKQLIDAVPD